MGSGPVRGDARNVEVGPDCTLLPSSFQPLSAAHGRCRRRASTHLRSRSEVSRRRAWPLPRRRPVRVVRGAVLLLRPSMVLLRRQAGRQLHVNGCGAEGRRPALAGRSGCLGAEVERLPKEGLRLGVAAKRHDAAPVLHQGLAGGRRVVWGSGCGCSGGCTG